MGSTITRRNFLAASAVSAGLLGLAGCASGTSGSSGSSSIPAADTYPIDAEEWGSGTPKHSEEVVGDERIKEGWTRVTNEGGATLGVMDADKLIQVDGFAFKDMNGNGRLDLWEDWRQDAAARAEAHAAEVDIDAALALLIHGSAFSTDYDLANVNVSGSSVGWSEDPDDPTTLQETLDQGIRTMLNFSIPTSDANTVVRWSNTVQAYAEGVGTGIPVNVSNNPIGFGFPGNLGMAATFDADLLKRAGVEQAKAYRAEGIATLLGPQMDLTTDPRWARINGTYGEDPALSRDLTNAYVSGLQSSWSDDGDDLGWGTESVVGMIKHFPGDGCGESGRESHNQFGKFCVYPGENMEAQLIPFVDGGLHLDSSTGECGAFMDSYSIAYSDDEKYGELVGSAFSAWKNDLLREKCGYDGLICSDWGVVEDASTPWGMESATKDERFKKIVEAGVDQIGGGFALGTLKKAYASMVADQGVDATDERVRTSARRVLKTLYSVGLNDNPYLSADQTEVVLADTTMATIAAEATDKSIVMLKNKGGVIKKSDGTKPKVYIPMKFTAGSTDALGNVTPGGWSLPVDEKTASDLFEVVSDALGDPTGEAGSDGVATYTEKDIVRATADQVADCAFAVVIVASPKCGNRYEGGYDATTKTYLPIPLQYGEYVADGPHVREESISGNVVDGVKENRSYLGQKATVVNSDELAFIQGSVALMQDKPVVVCVNATKPMVFSEFESEVAGILMGFGTKGTEFLNILSGHAEPSGLLPLQMPASMDAVEAQLEDVPRDMDCYVDSEGNEYDFAYGLNWSGTIDDERTKTYKADPLTSSEYLKL